MRRPIFYLPPSKTTSILVQILLWGIVFFFPLHLYNVRIEDPNFYKRECIDYLFIILLFYLNVNVLIPRYFVHKKKKQYFLFVLMALLAMIGQQLITEQIFLQDRVLFHGPAPERAHMRIRRGRFRDSGFNRNDTLLRYNGIPPRPVISEDIRHPGLIFSHGEQPAWIFGLPSFVVVMVLRKTLTTSLLVLLVGFFVKLSSIWTASEIEKESLQNEKLDAELKLLKAQVNPHFLFNTLNSIYALSHKKDQKVGVSILKLSGMMRYMIYDTAADLVDLHKELEYIKNYIDLQRLRLPSFIEIQYNETGNALGQVIPPMLLLPFIENAFKHGISYGQPSAIDIHITISENQIQLKISNPILPKEPNQTGGVGLTNIQRRLHLLFGQNYQLSVNRSDERYQVELFLWLNHFKSA